MRGWPRRSRGPTHPPPPIDYDAVFRRTADNVYAVCLASLGLWFSLVSRTTLRATLFTLLGAVLLILGPGVLAKMFGIDWFGGKRETWDELLIDHALMPSLTLWTLSFHGGELTGDDPLPFQRISAAVFGLHFYLLVAVTLWLSMVSRLRAEP